MDREFIFYVAIDRGIPQVLYVDTLEERQFAIERALAATGTEVGRVRTSDIGFAHAFERISQALGLENLLAQGAIAASPHDLLPDDDLRWRMGYFSPETTELIQAEIAIEGPALAALDGAPPPTAQVRDLFLAACDEAAASGQSIVIIHA